MKKKSSIRGMIPRIWNKKFFKVMRLTILFLLVGLMQVAASVYSQTTKLNLELQNSRVVDILDAIENQSEFRFAYSTQYIDVNRKVDVDIKDKSIEQTLSILFEGEGVKYSINDRHILLYPADMEQNSAQQSKKRDRQSDGCYREYDAWRFGGD